MWWFALVMLVINPNNGLKHYLFYLLFIKRGKTCLLVALVGVEPTQWWPHRA